MAASAAPPVPAGDDRSDRAFAAWFGALPTDAALVRFFDRKVSVGVEWWRGATRERGLVTTGAGIALSQGVARRELGVIPGRWRTRSTRRAFVSSLRTKKSRPVPSHVPLSP